MRIIHKSYRYTLEPSAEQARKLGAWIHALRFVWNWMLAQRRDIYEASERRVSANFAGQCAQLAPMKKMMPWLAELPSHLPQQALRDLDAAFVNFFRGRARYPKFKSKKRAPASSMRWPCGIRVNGRAVFFPKLGWVKARISRPVGGKIKSATVRWDGLRWIVSILCEIEMLKPIAPDGLAIGVDLGVEESFAVSDGRLIRLPVAANREKQRLAVLARRVSRCKAGSNRHAKAKRRHLVFSRSIGNRVQDARHNLTTLLAKNHGAICIEDLAIKDMTRSIRGTVEAPGKNVKIRSAMNRALLEQGHAKTVRQLDCKTRWLGGEVIRVDPAYTSQRCPECEHVSSANRPSRAVFRCVQCGHSGHADVIAATNILAAGLVVKARGGIGQVAPVESRTQLRWRKPSGGIPAL